jgi:hypothetical protein
MDLKTPIDFTPEARRRLVTEQRDAIEVLLALGFDQLADKGISLEPFGFRSTPDAVAWALARFETGTFDVAKLRCRTWRLFTQGRFWLAQKVGKKGYRRLVAEQSQRPARRAIEPPAPPSSGPDDDELKKLVEQAGETLMTLHRLVIAPGLISDWIAATEGLRSKWLFPPASGPAPLPPKGKVDKTRRHHEAMFRYQCVAHDLVDANDGDERAAVVACLFSRAENTPPFRSVVSPSPGGRKNQEEARREGLATLFLIIADEVSQDADGLWHAFRRAHAVRALTSTTVARFNLDRADMHDDIGKAIARVARFSIDPPWESAS